jgi:hypothetical protein
MKHELQHILSGKSQVRHGNTIQTITRYLRKSQSTSPMAESGKSIKKQEETFLKQFCDRNGFWITSINLHAFISSGAEQKVYLYNKHKVIKLNDGIYYETWEDYLNNLLLHNFFFPDTAYQLIGFYDNEPEKVLYAVVEQRFVESDSVTILENVKKFLSTNGFINTRNNDYFHPELGIILEDLHDENVLTFQENLFFIDTVFYLTEEFYK